MGNKYTVVGNFRQPHKDCEVRVASWRVHSGNQPVKTVYKTLQ